MLDGVDDGKHADGDGDEMAVAGLYGALETTGVRTQVELPQRLN